MERLTDKVAVITGGSRGIGLAAAVLFAQEGAKVLLVARGEEALQQAVTQIGSQSVSYVVADVSQPEQVEAYVQTAVERYGGIDLFVNNAGIVGQVTPITECPIDVFDEVMAINVRGVWLGLKYVIPEMQKRGGGSIVITSSIAGVKGAPNWSAYNASKHAEVGIMRCVAKECAPLGIRVNTVNPGLTETPMLRELFGEVTSEKYEESKRKMEAQLLLKRVGTAEEVAQLMLFLASDESSYCTGGVYMVDGGMSA